MIQPSGLLIDFVLVCQCFTGLMARYRNFKLHVIGVHVNALRFGVTKIWKSSVSRIAHPWSPVSMVSRENGPMRTKFEWKSSNLIGYLVKSKKKG